MMHNRADYRLYLVTDRNCLQQQTLEQAVEQAILGGVTLVQLREKAIASKEFYERALRIKAICHHYNVPLLINDRVDIALAVVADGVHIGQSDLPCGVVRQILGKDKIIGVSARTAQQAIQAQADGADYLGVGAMFATSTKQDAQTVTIASLTQIRQAVTLPIVAIGGINHTTLPALQQALQAAETSIDGVAVVSAILGQKDVKLASEKLKEMIKT
ncbi:thiamine phosphate synthase [Moraxella osloensis]|uniref:thiamine phosphate synthase n=1 Tax=Faucicola osloensis TaxID=34062 RepID=UPI0020062A96|nr:thiamine phosphate synthase [Moraxella osloensis]MCK6158601.1 thiamine phosphate synthase [Moraxella osloensis]